MKHGFGTRRSKREREEEDPHTFKAKVGLPRLDQVPVDPVPQEDELAPPFARGDVRNVARVRKVHLDLQAARGDVVLEQDELGLRDGVATLDLHSHLRGTFAQGGDAVDL